MDKIDPALPKVQSTTIANDAVFQSMLSSWLEEKGFIQDIRSQIRFQLVNVLKNTALGRNTCRKLSNNKSVSKQALNIIVAEYLLRNDYQYSLSVFSAEASLANIIPDNVLQSSNAQEPMLNDVDILNIFELLGISKTGIGKEILNIYYEQPQTNSILYCLIYILSLQMKESYRVIENSSRNVGVSNESIPVKQIYPSKSINPLDSDKNDQNIGSKQLEELTKYIKEREITEKLMKDLSKSNEKLKKGLFKLAEDYNILKNKKESTKNSLNKENLKNEYCTKKHFIEVQNESKCSLPHCGENCRDNSAKLIDLDNKYCYLQKENIDLKMRNTAQQKEMRRLAMRYNNLVNAIANCEHKLLPISTEVNIEDKAYFKLYETGHSTSKRNADLRTDELSSESVTEEIVRETWYKLRILEDECNKI